MTTKRTFTCNLCSGSVYDPAHGREAFGKEGIGVKFKTEAIEFVRLGDAENHLCIPCVEGIKGSHLKRYIEPKTVAIQ